MKKRLKLSVMTVFFAMLLGFALMFIGTEQASAMEGEGTKDKPCQISTYDELKAFATKVNNGETGACAILMADIRCGDTTWVPIGRSSNPYTGTFDGNGRIIENLSNEGSSAGDYQGLFGAVASGATIQNVGMKGVYFHGNHRIGAVAGKNHGTIINCYNTGNVSAKYGYLGGIAGENYGTITDCYNIGNVSSEYNNAGGIAGSNYGTITNCYNTGAVSGNYYVGGLTGWNASATIDRCYNTGNVSGYNDVGGVTGLNQEYATTTNCYNTGVVSGNQYIGGVTGLNQVYAAVTKSYSAGDVNGTSHVGGVTGSNQAHATTTSCYYDMTVCSAAKAVGNADDTDNAKGLPTSEMTGTDCTAFDPWDDFYAIWQLTESYPVLSPHDHELTYEEEQEPQSCVDPGHIAGYTCSVCGKHYSDTSGKTLIPDKNWSTSLGDHIWSPEWSSDGNEHWHECTKCGTKKDESGHDWSFEGFVWKGDRENGYTSAKAYYECEKVDSHVKNAVATMTEETTAPTCTEAGKTTYTATISAENSPDGIEHQESRDAKATKATGHTWDAGKVTKKATTTATGVKTHSCITCKATKTVTIPKLAKKANPLTIKAKTATVKYTAVKNKAQVIGVTKVIAFTKKGQGKLTYTKVSGNKKITINKTTGKVTVKKGLKKGTYKVKVKVKAAGNANYKASAVKTVTFKVRVK